MGSVNRGLLVGLALAVGAPVAQAGAILDHIRATHRLECGVVVPQADWNKTALHGDLSAFFAEFCKAVAVAATGQAVTATLERFATERDALRALAAGHIDLAAGVTPSLEDEAVGKIGFGPNLYYDAQAILVHPGQGIAKLTDLAGKKLCTVDGTRGEAVILHSLAQQGISVLSFSFQEEGEMEAGLLTGHCQAVGAPMSRLLQMRAAYANQLNDTIILASALGLDTASLAYARSDALFAALADATVSALIQADALGMTQANAARFSDNGDPATQSLLGIDGRVSSALGLERDWVVSIVTAVGNYDEIFARSFPKNADLRNMPWQHGGLMVPFGP